MANDRESGAAGASPPDWDALARHLAGEDDAADRARIERELAADPARSALIDALDAALRAPDTNMLTPSEVDAALDAVLARRDQGDGTLVVPLHPRAARWRRGGLRAAAAILVVVGATITWRALSRAGSASGNGGRQFATGVGMVDSLVLPDSSLVILGPASTLTVPADYGASSRELRLRGQALFDVRHDPSRQFIVRTGAAELRDVGTRFAVQSHSPEELRVAVLEGAVAIRATRAARSVTDTLRASDRGVMLADGVLRVERQTATGVEEDVAWMGRRLSLRDAPVSRVGAELARWYGLELRVTDSTLRSRRLTATLEHAPRAELARVLAAALGGTARLAGDTLWILPVTVTPAHR
jgi:transmembrane sensor